MKINANVILRYIAIIILLLFIVLHFFDKPAVIGLDDNGNPIYVE